MRSLTIVAVSLCALAALRPIESSGAESKLVFVHQGVERVATLFHPATLPYGPAPIVLALHGRNQTIESLHEWLHLDAAAEHDHFSVIYPEAIDRKWSYGRPIEDPMPTVHGTTVDDLGYLHRLIDSVINMKIADPAHIYVTGMSRGGLMTFTLACALADKIAAAVPLITGMTDHQREDCHPSRAIPLMVVAGTNDDAQWYDGIIASRGRLLSVPETMEYWRVRNGCSDEKATPLPHRDPQDPTNIRLIEWSHCSHHAQLKLYRVNEGGHQLPSFSPSDDWTTGEFGPRNHDIETADEIATFVKTIATLGH